MDRLWPVVKLQRYRSVIRCPGCMDVFQVEDECAAHLLKCCIQFRMQDDAASRRNLATWIVDYFKTSTYGEQNPPDAVKINSWLTNDRLAMPKKGCLRVRIPALSSMCCPVCCRFSLSSEACLEHLFAKCVYVESNDCQRVREWLCAYFSTQTKENLEVLRDVLSEYSASRVLCKYCKTEAPDRQSLMKHFPCREQRASNKNELMCEVCNLSVPSWPNMISHLLSRHYKCHQCGMWPKNRRVEFDALRHHLEYCGAHTEAIFRCPQCLEDVPLELETDLTAHIVSCRREMAVSAFDNRSLYGKCDIINCFDQVLLCDIDAHMTKHLRNGDLPSTRQKRLRMSVDELNSCERKNGLCCCNTNSR